MANTAVLFRVYAEGGKEADVRKSISEKLHPNSTALEEVAFGIKVIKVLFIHDDKTGSSEFEEKLKQIPGVNEVEVIEESLIS